MYIISDQGAPDIDPPVPNPMDWQMPPHASGAASIAMAASPASDPSGVEYLFECLTGGGHSSGWQDSSIYDDAGLQPGTQYTHTVKARDKSSNMNETGASSAASAITDAACIPGNVLIYSVLLETAN